MRRIRRSLFVALVAVCAAAPAASAQVASRAVAVTGDAAPGGGTFDFPQRVSSPAQIPAIAGGTIAFDCQVRDANGTGRTAIYVERDGELALLARDGDALLGGSFNGVGGYDVDRLGDVFVATHLAADATRFDAVVKFAPDGPVRLVGAGDETARGVIGALSDVSVAADGEGGAYVVVYFGADLLDTAVVHATAEGAVEVVAGRGDAAPGGGTYGTIWGPVASSEGGRLVFNATLNASTDAGAYFELGPDGVSRLAETGTASFFRNNPNVSVADDGVVFYRAFTYDLREATTAGVTSVVEEQPTIDRIGGYPYTSATQIAVSRAHGDDYAVLPARRSGDADTHALVRRGADGTLEALVAPGDTAPAELGAVFLDLAGENYVPVRFADEAGNVAFGAAFGGSKVGAGVFTTLNAVDAEAPTITSVALVGRKLVVTGERFAKGAKIVVGVTPYATKRGKADPTTLASKAAAKAADQVINPVVSVVNPDGRRSRAVVFVNFP